MKLRSRLSAIPSYARRPLIAVLIWEQIVYEGGKLLTIGRQHYDLTLGFDLSTPFLPWTVLIYLLSFAFWVICYIYCASQEKSQAYRFLCTDFLAKAVCLVIFLAIPTTNVRPELEGDSLGCTLMRFVYWVDSPYNLFPSIHCLLSWLCFLGVRDAPNSSPKARCAVFCIAIMIFISTLTTKQHVVVDVLGGVILAQLSYWAASKKAILTVYSKFADRLSLSGVKPNTKQ